MRRVWPLWVVSAWLAIPGAVAAHTEGTQRLGDAADGYFASLDPAMATAPGGHTAALAAAGKRMTVRRAAPGSPFTRRRLLMLGTRAGSPAVATGDELTALAWTHFDGSVTMSIDDEDCCWRLRAATMDPAGRVSRPRELSSPGYNLGEIDAVVRGRRAALACVDGRGVRASSASGRGGRFGPPRTLSRRVVSLLGVALGDSGPRVFMLWHSRVVEAWRAGGRARQRVLGRFARSDGVLTAAVTPVGHLLLVGTPRPNPKRVHRAVVAYRRPGGRLRRQVVRLGRRVTSPAIAVALSPTGRGLLAMQAGLTGIELRSVTNIGRVGRARRVRALATRSGKPTDLALAINAAGAGVLAAQVQSEHDKNHYTQTVAWVLAPGARPGRRRVLSFARPTFVTPDGVTATIHGTGRRRVAWVVDNDVLATRLR